MPSRLSSLLVRDGLVGVKRMERAFQRQVIYGGTLDTILLEMAAVPEERLLQYLSLSTGLPPATRGETERFDAEAVRVCSESVAREFQVAPLDYDGETLRVLVKEPVDFAVLERLADELDKPIQPMVVPEYRYHVVADRAYGRETQSRFVALLHRAEEERSPTPVGKAQTVIVNAGVGQDNDPADHVVVDVGLPPAAKPARRTLEMTTDSVREAAARAAAEFGVARRPATGPDSSDPVRTREPTADPDAVSDKAPAVGTAPGPGIAVAPGARPEREPEAETGREPEAEADREAGAGHEARAAAPSAATVTPSDGVPRPVDAARPRAATEPQSQQARGSMEIPAQRPAEPARPSSSIKVQEPEAVAVRQPGPPTRSRPPTGASVLVPQPISAAVAIERLRAAESRDEIFAALVQAVRGRAWYAGIMTVQGGSALGRVAIAGSEVDLQGISSVSIPLDADTAFRQTVTSMSPYIGPIATHDEAIDSMIRRMGGVVPPAALLLPVTVRERTVALVIGHRGADSISVAEVSQLLPLAGAAADAISRLILSVKKAGYRPALETGPTPQFAPEEVPIKGAGSSGGNGSVDKGNWSVPDRVKTPTLDLAAQPQPAAERAAVNSGPVLEDIDALLDKIEADEDVDGRAAAALMRRAPEAVERVAERFPGKISIDRYELGGRALRAERHGALLGLVVKLGTASSDMLMDRMADENRDVRYYATLCTGELRPRSALPSLVDRLFDQDYGVRNAALSALAGYPAREVEPALVRARQLLHSDDPWRCKAAANALGELGDVASIPDLLDAVSRRDEAGEAARQALSQLTRQNFGSNQRKWRSWWGKHKGEHRLEWLIEALSHKDAGLRSVAAEELRRVTGEYFGFHHDMSRREREEARKRWSRWWNETGRHRFVRQGVADAQRRTELIPARRP